MMDELEHKLSDRSYDTPLLPYSPTKVLSYFILPFMETYFLCLADELDKKMVFIDRNNMVTSVRDYYTCIIPSAVPDDTESHCLSEILILVWSMIHDLYENIRNGDGFKGIAVPHKRITLYYTSLLQVFML